MITETRIIDVTSHNYVEVTEDNALLVKGISDLIATLQHCGAYEDNQLKMKDVDTGQYFKISLVEKDD